MTSPEVSKDSLKDVPDLRLAPPRGSVSSRKGATNYESSYEYKALIKSDYEAQMKSVTSAERKCGGSAEGKLGVEDGGTQEGRYEKNCGSNERDKEGNRG